MAKKIKSVEEHLVDIKYLLVGILLNRKPSVKEVAKIVGCSDKKISELYPAKEEKNGQE